MIILFDDLVFITTSIITGLLPILLFFGVGHCKYRIELLEYKSTLKTLELEKKIEWLKNELKANSRNSHIPVTKAAERAQLEAEKARIENRLKEL